MNPFIFSKGNHSIVIAFEIIGIMRYLLIGMLCLFSTFAFAQEYIMNGSPINDCDGRFYDSGGPNGGYGSFENLTTTICPDNNLGMQIRLSLSNINLGLGDELCFYDGDNTNAPLLSCITTANNITSLIIQATDDNPGGCITVEFDSDFLFGGDGWESVITCIPKCQRIEAMLLSSDPPVIPADTGWIDVCPGQEVYFSAAGVYPENGTTYNQSDASSSFFWEFGDGSTAAGKEVTHTFEESGGYIVQVFIRDSFDCRSSNFISQRVRVAPAPDFEITPPPGPICVGDSLQLQALVGSTDPAYTVSVEAGEGTFFRDPVRSDSLPLPDGDGASYETSISIFDFAPGQTLNSINDLLDICVNMEHSYMNDLEIKITCPSGNEVILQNQVSYINEVFLGEPYQLDDVNTPMPPGMGVGYDYCWSPTANRGTWTDYVNSTNVQTLPPGDYNSFESLNALLGCPLNGEWTITVTDLWENDNGWIFQWSINFDPDIYPTPETFRAAITDFSWRDHPDILERTNTDLLVSPDQAGQIGYTFQVTNAFGCTYDTTVYVEVLPATHPDCGSCLDLETPLRDTSVCDETTLLLDAGNLQSLGQQQIAFASHPMQYFAFEQYPPSNALESTISVNNIIPATLTNANQQIESVCVEVEHDYVEDVSLFLEAPNGNLLELSTGNGGNGANYQQTCFRPTATQAISSASAPFNGSFQPEGSWAVLNSTDINGDWTLWIADDDNSPEEGRIISWSISFVHENNLSLSWLPANQFTCPDCSEQLVQIQSDTSFVVEIRDEGNCQFLDTIHIELLEELPPPIINCQFAGPGMLLFSWEAIPSAIQYEVSFDGGINWQPSNLPLGHQLMGLSLNEVVQIWVRAVAPGECSAQTASSSCEYEGCTFAIDTLSTQAPSCFDRDDGIIRLNFSGGFGPVDYFIGNIGPFRDSITGLIAGNYSIRAIDALGCEDTLDIALNAPPALQIGWEIQAITCVGAEDGQLEGLITGGASPYTYNWSVPGSNNTPQISGLSAGIYTLSVVDRNGCSTSSSQNLIDPLELTVDLLLLDASCFGNSDGEAQAFPAGGSLPYTYQWSNTSIGTTASNLAAGTYTLTLSDANGCTLTTGFSIGHPSELLIQLEQSGPICSGSQEGWAIATGSGGLPPYTFDWSNAVNSDSIQNLAAGTYRLTLTDAAGCSKQSLLDIQENAPILVDLLSTRPSCYGAADGQLSIENISGGNGANLNDYFVQWEDGSTALSRGNLTGNQTYSVTVTDNESCSVVSTIRLDNPLPIQLTIDQQAVSCFGGLDGRLAAQASGEYPVFDYRWSTGDSTMIINNLVAGAYQLTVTDSSGCWVDTVLIVAQPDEIQAAFEVTPNTCHSENEARVSVRAIGGFPGYTFAWSNGSDSSAIGQLPTDWYMLTITDARGCTTIDSVWTGEEFPLTARLQADSISCFGEEDGRISIFASGGSPPYRYSLNELDQANQNTWVNLSPGFYTVLVQDANDCEWEQELFLTEPPPLMVEVGNDQEIELGDSIQLIATVSNTRGNYQLEWEGSYPGTLNCADDDTLCLQPYASPLYTITYTAWLTDDSGCSTQASFELRVKKNRSILVPTGFSPNGDGRNDRLLLHGKNPPGTRVLSFKVFDRWGEQIFEATDFSPNDSSIGWDGSFRGEAMQPGVYVWVAEVAYIDGFSEVFKGNTTLIR